MIRTITVAGLLMTGWLLALPAQADSLAEIYERARLNDPAIREAEANMLATMEAKPQALANLLPQINSSANWQNSQRDGTQIFQFGEGAAGAEEGITDSDVDAYGWSVDVRQTLLNTDQWRRYKRSNLEVAQAEINYRAAQQDLMIRVSDAYFNVLAAQDQLASERAAKDAIARQLEQAQRRFEVGLIAITDVKESQAGFDDSVALEIAAQRQLATAKEALREITGEYPQELAAPDDEFPLIPPDPQVEQDWVDVSLQQNMTLESARIGADITRENVRISRSGHLPTLDLFASYGNNNTDGDSFTSTPTLGENNNAIGSDIDTQTYGVQFTLPIFSGGGVSSVVQQNVYLHRAAKEQYERAARETERLTRDAYLGVIAEIARVQALARAEDSNATALEATEAGYEVGTRTTVDVLNSRQSLFLTQTQYARAKYDYMINVLRLKQAAGTLTEDDIFEVNSWLNITETLPETPGRGAAPDVQMEEGTPTEGAALDLPALAEPESDAAADEQAAPESAE